MTRQKAPPILASFDPNTLSKINFAQNYSKTDSRLEFLLVSPNSFTACENHLGQQRKLNSEILVSNSFDSRERARHRRRVLQEKQHQQQQQKLQLQQPQLQSQSQPEQSTPEQDQAQKQDLEQEPEQEQEQEQKLEQELNSDQQKDKTKDFLQSSSQQSLHHSSTNNNNNNNTPSFSKQTSPHPHEGIIPSPPCSPFPSSISSYTRNPPIDSAHHLDLAVSVPTDAYEQTIAASDSSALVSPRFVRHLIGLTKTFYDAQDLTYDQILYLARNAWDTQGLADHLEGKSTRQRNREENEWRANIEAAFCERVRGSSVTPPPPLPPSHPSHPSAAVPMPPQPHTHSHHHHAPSDVGAHMHTNHNIIHYPHQYEHEPPPPPPPRIHHQQHQQHQQHQHYYDRPPPPPSSSSASAPVPVPAPPGYYGHPPPPPPPPHIPPQYHHGPPPPHY